MDLYALDKLIPEARKLAAEYRKATGQSLGVSVEIARHDAARLLQLELLTADQQGHDAVGTGAREGLRVLIKGRAIFDESKSGQRLGQLKLEHAWDLLVVVLMDEEYQPVEIYELPRSEIDAHVETSPAKNKRGAITIAKVKAVGQLAWTREDGAEDDVWTNA